MQRKAHQQLLDRIPDNLRVYPTSSGSSSADNSGRGGVTWDASAPEGSDSEGIYVGGQDGVRSLTDDKEESKQLAWRRRRLALSDSYEGSCGANHIRTAGDVRNSDGLDRNGSGELLGQRLLQKASGRLGHLRIRSNVEIKISDTEARHAAKMMAL